MTINWDHPAADKLRKEIVEEIVKGFDAPVNADKIRLEIESKEAFDRYMKKYGHIRPICYRMPLGSPTEVTGAFK